MEEFSYGRWLAHHGIKVQKWGIRRFQNRDGSLTTAGRKRYDDDSDNSKSSVNKKEAANNTVSGSDKPVSKMKKAEVEKYAKEQAAKTTKEERKEYVDAYNDMLDKDPEHYYPYVEFRDPPKVDGKSMDDYANTNNLDEYLDSPEYKQYEKEYNEFYEKTVKPYAEKSKAAEEKVDNLVNDLTTKYMGFSAKPPYFDMSDSEFEAMWKFQDELTRIYYHED